MFVYDKYNFETFRVIKKLQHNEYIIDYYGKELLIKIGELWGIV